MFSKLSLFSPGIPLLCGCSCWLVPLCMERLMGVCGEGCLMLRAPLGIESRDPMTPAPPRLLSGCVGIFMPLGSFGNIPGVQACVSFQL